jgi:ribokinase
LATVSEPAVLSLGSINLDLSMRAEGWPTQSQTTLARDFACRSGGKGANVACLAQKLGVPARLIGRVGDDSFAELALSGPRALDVDLSRVRRVPGQATGVAMIALAADGDKTIVLAANANDVWQESAGDELAHLMRMSAPGSLLVVDLEVPPELVVEAARSARQRDVRVIVDPSPAERVPDALYPLIDFVTPNPSEAQQLTGVHVDSEDAAVRAGHALVERGVKHACIKLAQGGAVLVTREGSFVQRAPHVPIVDKTGAGDAFAGGLAVGLLWGQSARSALRTAVAAASLAVQAEGSQESYPRRAELERLLREMSDG